MAFKGSKGSKGGKPKVSAFARAAAASTASEPKGDEFDAGKFRVGFLDMSEGENGAFCLKLVGRGEDEEIGERIQWFSTAGKALRVSAPRIKSLCRAITGLDEEQYNEFDPHGQFINSIAPYDIDAAAAYLVEAGAAKNEKAARAAIEEVEFYIKVTKGGDKDDGGWFRNASFMAIDEGDDSEDEDDTDEEPESEPAPRAVKKKASKRRPVDEDEDDAEDEDLDDDSEDDEDEEPESRPAKKKASKKAGRK